MTLQAYIAEHKVETEGGINWTWAYFPDKEKAVAFDTFAKSHGYETRGVYNPDSDDDAPTYSVRYR